jgi:hypothetical protein
VKITPALGYSTQQNYHAKLTRSIKIFHDKHKLKQYMTPYHYYRRFYKEFFTQKMKANKTMRGWEISNHRRKKDK